jgi:small conductance mechanosensitive channel
MKEELTEIPNATGKLEVWGINDLAESAVVYRIAVLVKPTKQFETERYLRKEIRKYFKKNNIEIPYNQIEVHNGK